MSRSWMASFNSWFYSMMAFMSRTASQSPPEFSEQSTPTEIAVAKVIGGAVVLPTTRPFILEVMVTAGPRHELSDDHCQPIELGEDCTGHIAIAGTSIFWICDGTSNSTTLPKTGPRLQCSSRILAQDIAARFAAVMVEKRREQVALDDIDLKLSVFEPVARDWEERLAVYVQQLNQEGTLNALLESLPQSADGSYEMKWSTTFLGGLFDETNRTLDLVNYGDCGAVVAAEPGAVVEPNPHRVIFLAHFTAERNPSIFVAATTNDQTSWRRWSDVKGFLAMTDGVVKTPSLKCYLARIHQQLDRWSLLELRRHLGRMKDATEDDKALILGRFLE